MEQWEVIVVDDGSEPPLASIVEQHRANLQIRYLRVPNAGPAVARNQGARIAAGRYLAFTDHDCLPAPGWLAALRDGFQAHPDHMLGGPKENGLPDRLCSSAHQIASNFAERWFLRADGASAYFTTNNMAVPRESFLQIGGFNESFPFAHEDREFGARWADHGLLRAWIPTAVVVHSHPLTLGAFLRQQYRYGAGAVDFRAARKQAPAENKVRFEGLRFHCGLVAAPFAGHPAARAFLLASLIVAAQAAYVAGVVTASLARR